jgi:hypothetical protein
MCRPSRARRWLAESVVPAASAKPILLPTLQGEIHTQNQIWQQHVFAPKGHYQTVTDAAGQPYNQYITNPTNQLAAEAARAVAHFHITDLANANIVVAPAGQLQRSECRGHGVLRVP